MNSHVWRPLYVVAGIVAIIFVARLFFVPADFGIGDRGYMYGWHRAGNVEEWKAIEAKHRTASYCKECHKKEFENIIVSSHRNIQCENCHGPALRHPDDPPTLAIDRHRALCARCHARLSYTISGRKDIRGIAIENHHPEAECTLCHWPHNPKREGGKP